MTAEDLTLHVYRNLDNRIAGEPDDGSLAWQAHRERLRVLQETLDDPAFRVRDWGVADDTERPHELAEVVAEVLANPTVQAIAWAAAGYAGRLVAQQIDERLGGALSRVLDRLLSAFRSKQIGDFWITLPDGSSVQVDANANVSIRLRDGKPVDFHVDSPPG
jgi:hypothetical protein